MAPIPGATAVQSAWSDVTVTERVASSTTTDSIASTCANSALAKGDAVAASVSPNHQDCPLNKGRSKPKVQVCPSREGWARIRTPSPFALTSAVSVGSTDARTTVRVGESASGGEGVAARAAPAPASAPGSGPGTLLRTSKRDRRSRTCARTRSLNRVRIPIVPRILPLV